MGTYLEISELYFRNMLAEVSNLLMGVFGSEERPFYRGIKRVDTPDGRGLQICEYIITKGMSPRDEWVIATVSIENPFLVVVRTSMLMKFLCLREPLQKFAEAFPVEGVQFVLHYDGKDTELSADAKVYDMSIPK